MSHHPDAPVSRRDVRLNVTDVYAFRGEIGTVLIMNVNNSVLGNDAPKGFHPEARYEIRIDLNRDAVEDLAYRVTFSPRDDAGMQRFELRRLTGRDARDPAAMGALLASGSTESATTVPGGLGFWAGLASDPFYIDLTVLRAAGAAFRDGTKLDLSGWQPGHATNVFRGTTVNTIVLEISDGSFEGLLGPDQQIGVWATSTLATDAGGWRPINRAGRPMIQPIFSPDDSERASAYNATHPADDIANYTAPFAEVVANVVAAYGTSDDPAAYGKLVAGLLLPDILPYRIGSTASYSFADRNSRTLTDNTVDVMFSLATNSALTNGLTARDATVAPRAEFPYVAAPVQAAAPARVA
jgi:hypothetical protein